MSIAEFDGRQSWSLDASETFLPALLYAIDPATSTHRHFVLSPVSLASRDQGGGHSNSPVDIFDLTKKIGGGGGHIRKSL